MKARHHIILLLATAGLTMLALASYSCASTESLDLRAEPHRILINESFHGRHVHFSAQIPRGTQAVVELKGQTHKEHLVQKGRRWGLWMSVGEVTVKGAPSLYLVATTDPKLLLNQKSADRWGYGALREQIKFSEPNHKPGEVDLFSQFIKLKERERLYGEFPGAIKVVALTDKVQEIRGQLKLPGNVRPEEYVLSISVLEDGQILERRHIKLHVVMEHLTAFLYSLSQRHPTLYGFLAAAIAMAMGLLTGFVFKGKGAH